MKVVFDTNIVHDDFHLQGARVNKLVSAAKKLDYDLMVPDVVVDEMVSQYRNKLLQCIHGYANLLKLVSRTQGGDDKIDRDAFIKQQTSDYEAFLRKRLIELGIQVIDYPTIDIRTLVSKDLYVRKPFKEIKEGYIGYRDALLWESVKSVCQPPTALIEEPQVEFLTENTKDFAGSGYSLHQDLVEELKDAGLAENCILLEPDIKAFFETKINPELETLEQIKITLQQSGKFNRFDLSDEVSKVLSEDYVTEVLNESDFDSGERAHIPGYMEDPTIRRVDIPIIKDVSVRRLSDQIVLIEVQAAVEVGLDFFVFKPDYYLIDEDRLPDIVDGEWNEHYMYCESTIDVYFHLAFRTTPKVGKILSLNVQVEEVLT